MYNITNKSYLLKGYILFTPTNSSIFERYEEIRSRMPQVETTSKFEDIELLLNIADQDTIFFFDAFGVLNVGEALINGPKN